MFKNCCKPVSAKFDDFLTATKLNEILHRKQSEKKKHTLLVVLAVIGAVAAVAGIAYCVYKCMNPDYLDDFDDEFDDEFDTNFEGDEE